MKPSSFLVQATYMLLAISAVIGCDSPAASPSNSMLLNRQVVADIFGNHDGVATPDELLALDDFFQANAEGWCVSSLSDQLWNSDEVSGDQAKACFLAIEVAPFFRTPRKGVIFMEVVSTWKNIAHGNDTTESSGGLICRRPG